MDLLVFINSHLISCDPGSREDVLLCDPGVGFAQFLEAQEVEWWHQPKFPEVQAPKSRPIPEASQVRWCQKEMTHISFRGNVFDVLRVA